MNKLKLLQSLRLKLWDVQILLYENKMNEAIRKLSDVRSEINKEEYKELISHE